MTIVGYGRVSTTDQHPEAQHDALTKAGCDKLFIDEGASGKLASRPRWDACREYLRPGDQLTITKLDRLGRSIQNLLEISAWLREQGIELKVIDQAIDTMTIEGRLFFAILAAIAEFEHELIVQRTKDGLAAARARGRKGGGVPKLNDKQKARARELYDSQTMTVAEIGKTLGVSRQTIYRTLEEK
jgi:DNA invertase Pin-like site-specific DNA recombinase